MNIFETFVTKSEGMEKTLLKIREQEIPEFFDQSFLEELGITKPNSIHYVILFKKLGLINDDKKPVEKYYIPFSESESQSRMVLASRMKEVYHKVFELDSNVHNLSEDEVHSLFRTVMGDEKSSTFVSLVADTFLALSRFADWDALVDDEPPFAPSEIAEDQETDANINEQPVDSQSGEHTAAMSNDRDKHEETEQPFELIYSEAPEFQNQNGSSGRANNGGNHLSAPPGDQAADWFRKPVNGHEEFLMELLQGENGHSYENESTRNSSKNSGQQDESKKKGGFGSLDLTRAIPFLGNNNKQEEEEEDNNQ
ncbi:MAG: DUF5343 domain-containing protein, partial [Balneolaceae bacterium]|nr:DUF5343 domain-containing protein [Balneolaceae bacterium]